MSAVLGLAGTLAAEPTVTPTTEGQIGPLPLSGEKILSGPRFESVRGQPGDILFGGLFVAFDTPSPPPEFRFITDTVHEDIDPTEVAAVPATFDYIAKLAPASARSRNAADDGDFVAFSFALDGTLPQTQTIRVATFDENGGVNINVPILTNVGVPVPDPSLSDTGVAVDDQGRVTVVYTDLPAMSPPNVKAQRLDAVSGLFIGGTINVSDAGHSQADVALLDPAGKRLIIPSSDFSSIRGNVVDFSGAAPVVLPEFPISTTAGFSNINPAVGADPATGAYTVAWENVTGAVGDPVNIRARRFDAMGNPLGGDFLVNTTTANSQGQQAVAYGPVGESVIVWAGDAAVAADELDIFAQAYDANGQPIGGEIKVNTVTTNVQDQPTVRFLPEPTAQGAPQFVVAWRDVGAADGTSPRGTGTSYRCYKIDGLPGQQIFTDGFESGNTSSWSAKLP